MDSTGKHGRVFGGTTGIGFGIAEKLPKHGANMSVASRKQGSGSAPAGPRDGPAQAAVTFDVRAADDLAVGGARLATNAGGYASGARDPVPSVSWQGASR